MSASSVIVKPIHQEGSRPRHGLSPPIEPGSLVVYRDSDGTLRGGCDERQHGTIWKAHWSDDGWSFTLTDGTVLVDKAVISVAEVGTDGRIVAAWAVRDYGIDGTGQNT